MRPPTDIPSSLSPAAEQALLAAVGVCPLLLGKEFFESALAPGFESLAEALPDPLFIVQEGIIGYANPAAVNWLSVDRWEIEEHPFTKFCPPGDCSAIEGCFKEVEREVSPRTMRTRFVTSDPQGRSVELRLAPLVRGRDTSVVVTCEDIAEPRASEEGLLQADRSAALGLLAGGMAHALNNPLTYVLLNLDHIGLELPRWAREPELAADLLARVAEAREGAERMAGVVRRMHLFSRAHETEPTLVSLSAVLESVLELLGHEIRHRGALTTRLGEVPLLLARKSWVEQICLRLLLFAALSLPEDSAKRGAISLRLGTGSSTSPEGQVLLEVLCENVSLQPGDIPDLTSDPLLLNPLAGSPGSLAVCQRLVVQLGGTLVVELLPGRGLEVRASFPTAPATPPPSAPKASPPPSPVIPSRTMGVARIMVIDDDLEVGRALRLLLAFDHHVECATEPRRALRLLLQDPSFDLIFCDMMMPQLGGPEVYQALRYNRPGYESRLVFMSGGAFEASVQRFLAEVPNPRIDKPFNLSVVQQLVERAIKRRGKGG